MSYSIHLSRPPPGSPPQSLPSRPQPPTTIVTATNIIPCDDVAELFQKISAAFVKSAQPPPVEGVRSKTRRLRNGGDEMYRTTNRSPADAEAIEILIAISQVSARLAGRLAILAAHRQSKEGGQHNEQDERDGTGHRGAAQRWCLYY